MSSINWLMSGRELVAEGTVRLTPSLNKRNREGTNWPSRGFFGSNHINTQLRA